MGGVTNPCVLIRNMRNSHTSEQPFTLPFSAEDQRLQPLLIVKANNKVDVDVDVDILSEDKVQAITL